MYLTVPYVCWETIILDVIAMIILFVVFSYLGRSMDSRRRLNIKDLSDYQNVNVGPVRFFLKKNSKNLYFSSFKLWWVPFHWCQFMFINSLVILPIIFRHQTQTFHGLLSGPLILAACLGNCHIINNVVEPFWTQARFW